MHAEGLDIRPLRELTGAAMFNEVFFNDVFVPDDAVIGLPGDGWRIGRTTLGQRARLHVLGRLVRQRPRVAVRSATRRAETGRPIAARVSRAGSVT